VRVIAEVDVLPPQPEGLGDSQACVSQEREEEPPLSGDCIVTLRRGRTDLLAHVSDPLLVALLRCLADRWC
jgi:hypothetical protein